MKLTVLPALALSALILGACTTTLPAERAGLIETPASAAQNVHPMASFTPMDVISF